MAGMQKAIMKEDEYTDAKYAEASGKGTAAPIAKFRAGQIQVAVWANEGKDGATFKSFSMDKRYKVGEEWRSTKSMSANDLPKAILALQKAFEYAALKEDVPGATA